MNLTATKLVKLIGKLVFADARRLLHIPYQPLIPCDSCKRILNRQHKSGIWLNREDVHFAARFGIMVEYCRLFGPQCAILDVRCGHGSLLLKLNPSQYARYVGLDCSREAIDMALTALAEHKRNDDSVSFHLADAEAFSIEAHFDVIVFMESLYYFSDPHKALAHYASFLKPHGVFIISTFVTPQTLQLWPQLDRNHTVLDEVTLVDWRGWQFMTKVLAPKADK